MARTALTVATPKGPYDSVSANGLDFAFTAADEVNGNAFVCSGRELVLMRNDHATDAATVTIASAPDPYGRTKDITAYSLAAGEFAAFWVGKSVGLEAERRQGATRRRRRGDDRVRRPADSRLND